MNAPQGTEAWLQSRYGWVTGSRFSDVLAKIKTGEALTRKKYRTQVVTERLTNKPTTSYTNAAMQWGTETEPEARDAYQAFSGHIVDQVGFVPHPEINYCGGSPDGLIDDDGMIEIKCPESTTHLDWMEADRVPSQHVPQIQGYLWITNRKWCDFVSYDPRFPERLRLFVVRVPRDDGYIAMLEAEVKVFLSEVNAMCKRLMER